MITTSGMQAIGNFFLQNIIHGQYRIGNTWYNMNIFQTRQENKQVVFFFNLDDSVVGTITGKRLIQKDGTVFDEQLEENIVKAQTQGLLLVFRYNFREIEE